MCRLSWNLGVSTSWNPQGLFRPVMGLIYLCRGVARMGEVRGVHKVLVEKPEGKRPMARPRRRWEDNIKMDLQEGGGGCGDWMELVQDRDRWRALMNTVLNLRVPKMRGISWLAAEPVRILKKDSAPWSK